MEYALFFVIFSKCFLITFTYIGDDVIYLKFIKSWINNNYPVKILKDGILFEIKIKYLGDLYLSTETNEDGFRVFGNTRLRFDYHESFARTTNESLIHELAKSMETRERYISIIHFNNPFVTMKYTMPKGQNINLEKMVRLFIVNTKSLSSENPPTRSPTTTTDAATTTTDIPIPNTTVAHTTKAELEEIYDGSGFAKSLFETEEFRESYQEDPIVEGTDDRISDSYNDI